MLKSFNDTLKFGKLLKNDTFNLVKFTGVVTNSAVASFTALSIEFLKSCGAISINPINTNSEMPVYLSPFFIFVFICNNTIFAKIR